MEKLKLGTPLIINGKKVCELTYDADAITVGHFAEAEARKLKATTAKAGGSAGAFELDYTLHLYLGMMAVIAVNPEIDVTDLERIAGADLMTLMRVGRNFTTSRSAVPSEEDTSEELSEATPEPSTPPSVTSKKKD